MDRFTRTADIIKAYYSYKQTADSATFVKKVCSFFDFIKDESLSDADLNLLLFLANEKAESRADHTFGGDSKYCSNHQCGYTKSTGSITIITCPDRNNNGTKENPGTGAAPGNIG